MIVSESPAKLAEPLEGVRSTPVPLLLPVTTYAYPAVGAELAGRTALELAPH
jgi:hypothetical protein